ncbi:alpha/beta fold hydrolase [Streptomyces sp. NPDC052309]|uniref:alpha/beta fold hydrolase n=1 Tax=Streptomyces sp. NPDC052309 TaxID=3155421 RepID=UPI0034282405
MARLGSSRRITRTGVRNHVETPTLRIAYEADGPEDGQAVVAVHGWPDDIHCWDGVLPHLHRAGHRVYRPYLRGFGDTRFQEADRPRSGQIGALGQDLSDFTEALDLHDVVLAGHDWGARAGYVAGALFPERIRALIAVSAGHATNRPDSSVPYPLAHAYWYEWYVATARGRRALERDRRVRPVPVEVLVRPGGTSPSRTSSRRPRHGTTPTGPRSASTPICTVGARRPAIPPTRTSRTGSPARPPCASPARCCTVSATATNSPRPPRARTTCSPGTTSGS